MIKIHPPLVPHLTYPVVIGPAGRRMIVELSGDEINNGQTSEEIYGHRIVARAIDDILSAMLKLQNDSRGNYAPMSADTHLAEAVMRLSALVGITTHADADYSAQLEYCRKICDFHGGNHG